MGEVKVLKYRTADVPRQSGEVGRLRILKGAEVGATFVLKASSVTMGRGDEVNIMIGDLKASRSHARLDFTKDGWMVSDLGSANGIFFQGEYIRKFGLRSGEHFTIGETIFEFLVSDEHSRILTAPMKDAAEVHRHDIALAQQKVKVQNLAQGAQTVKKKTNPRTILMFLAAVGYYFYSDYMDDQKAAATKPHQKAAAKTDSGEASPDAERSLATYLPSTVSKDVEKTAEQYYSLGFREYMEGNYLRAKDNFELALQVNPAHARARRYLATVEQEKSEEIKRLIEDARKAKLVGRVKDAKGDCETALRHLYNDRANPDYADCAEILKEINGEDQP